MLKLVVPGLLLLASSLLSLSHAGQGVLPVIELEIAQYSITAEVANTSATRAAGLMHRTHLPEDHGMLFVFPTAAIYSMWMQNTPLPLSVAFLDEAGAIINIAEMAPNTLTAHRAEKAAKYALEMNAGWFAAKGIQAGDAVRGIEGAASAR
ncbi:MAG: DUF192 domain-containing protein [Nitrosomonas halophila]